MVEHRSEGVLGVVAGGGVLDRLADGHPERTRAVGRLGQDRPAVVRRQRGAGHDLRAVCLHQDPAIRLLVVAGADHVDLDLEAEERAGEGHGTPPLARARLGRDPGDALLLVVEGLGDGGVGLVAAGRADALVLVVDVRRRIERLLEAVRPVERAGPVQPVRVADRLGDLDLALGRHFLADEGHREERGQVVRSDRAERAGMQVRSRRDRQVGRDVVPGARDPRFVEDELRLPGIRWRHHALLHSP